MLAVLVERTDTLLEGKQRFVDFSSLDARLPVIVIDIRRPLATGEINKGKLATFGAFPPEVDLQHRMRARRVHVGTCGCC